MIDKNIPGEALPTHIVDKYKEILLESVPMTQHKAIQNKCNNDEGLYNCTSIE